MRRQTGKSGKAGKAPSAKTAKVRRPQPPPEEGLQPIPTPAVSMPMWIKFAIPTAVIIVALLVFQGLLVSNQMSKELDEQINKRGVDLVTLLAEQVPEELWLAQVPPDIVPPVPDEMLKEHNRRLREELTKDLDRRLAAISANSLDDETGRREIVEILILDYDQAVSRATLRSSSGSGQTSLETSGEGQQFGSVRIYRGQLGEQAVREFRLPIKRNGEHLQNFLQPGNYGWVSVFVDAQAIEDAEKKSFFNILIITFLGALAAVIVIVLIATLFTRPIRQLQSDMALVASGHLGHKTTIDSKDEIGALASVFDVMTGNLLMAQAQEADRKALERELTIANEIQENLLPQRVPQIPGFDIHRHYESAKEVGGDYYDFLVIDQRHLGIVVADVSGKGIPGSMVMTMVRSLLRLASVRNFSPADTFKKVNRILHRDIRRGMFVTAIYMVLDIVEKKLRVASAGHNPLVVYRAESGKVELVKPKGIALGFDKGPIFDTNIREVEIELKPGDRITAYTDGVNEAMDVNEEEFGDDHFYELVREHANLSSEEFIQKIVQALKAHQGNADQSDDITLATLAVQK